jgi:hypothetical protein
MGREHSRGGLGHISGSARWGQRACYNSLSNSSRVTRTNAPIGVGRVPSRGGLGHISPQTVVIGAGIKP